MPEFVIRFWLFRLTLSCVPEHFVTFSASKLASGNTVKDNLIHDVDTIGSFCSGITLPFSAGNNNEIQYNTIYASGRHAIVYLGGTGHDISYNNLFDAMMLSRDGAEIYASIPGGSAAGSHVHHNWLHDTQSLIAGVGDTYALGGVYLDEDTGGAEIDQNVLWNNQYYSILLGFSGTGVTSPNDNYVHNNSIPDVGSTSNIWTDLNTPCGTTQIVNNLVLVSVLQQGTVCTANNNSSAAPGATEMNSSVEVGCNFTGCASSVPPAISGTSVAASIAVQPYDMTVSLGQPVTFSVTGAGSPTLAYQWRRNGANIAGATSASYTISATSGADNGAMFTVVVTNSVGSATSEPAILTVQ